MKNLTINKIESFDDLAGLGDLVNNACASAQDLFLIDYQVQIDITAENKNGERKEFAIILQSEERANGMMAYCNYGMTRAEAYGCDADESGMLYGFLEETEEDDFAQAVIDYCTEKAEELAKVEYQSLLDELEVEQ